MPMRRVKRRRRYQLRARDTARKFRQDLDGRYPARMVTGIGVVSSVVRDGIGIITHALGTVDGLGNQKIETGYGGLMHAGDVWLVENHGTPSMPRWIGVRRVTAGASVPHLDNPTLPAPTGLGLSTDHFGMQDDGSLLSYIYATWLTIDDRYGEMQYELQYRTNDLSVDPASRLVQDRLWTTELDGSINASQTAMARKAAPSAAEQWDFPRLGRVQVEAEAISYTAVTDGDGESGSGGVGAAGTFTVSGAGWTADEWIGYLLVDSAADCFLITDNTTEVLTVSSVGFGTTPANGTWDIKPCFSDISRGVGASDPATHADGIGVIRRSCAGMLPALSAKEDYNVRVRALRADGAISAWTAWATETAAWDDVAPPAPTGLAVTSVIGGVLLSWTGPLEADVPDLSGFDIYDADDDSGTGAALVRKVGKVLNATVAMIPAMTRYFNIKAFDMWGNISAYGEATWLEGTAYVGPGANLLTNGDFERDLDDDSYADDWTFVETHGAAALTNNGIDGSQCVTWTGVDSTKWTIQNWYTGNNGLKSRRMLDMAYCWSIHFKPASGFTWSDVAFASSVPGSPDGKVYVFVQPIFSGPGLDLVIMATCAEGYYVGDGWYKIYYSMKADYDITTYPWIGMQITVSNQKESPSTISFHIDRAKLEMGVLPLEWAPNIIAPAGSGSQGILIDSSGIITSDRTYRLGPNGKMYSHLERSDAGTRNIGTASKPWDTVYANNFTGGGGTSFAPIDAHYVVMSLDGDLTDERVLTAGDGIDLVNGGAGGNATLSVDVVDIVDTAAGITYSSNDIQVNLGTGLAFSTGAVVLDFSGTPGDIEPDDAAAGGSSLYAARLDHQHGIICAVPGSIEPDDGAVEGSAASFSRSDHQHAIVCASASTLDVFSVNAEGDASSFARSNHIHTITTSSDPQGTEKILASDSSGHLMLLQLGLGSAVVSPTTALHIRHGSTPQFILEYNASKYANIMVGSGGSLEFEPTGNVVVDPGGNYVNPEETYGVNLGHVQKKYLSLHVAEIWADSLVARDVMATIGGRILVGATSKLTQDLDAADTTIYVDHNNLESGDTALLEKNMRVEFIAITSAATESSNELSNNSFETAGGGGADIWADWDENAGDGALADDTVIYFWGSHACKITSGASFNTYVSQTMSVTGGLRYQVVLYTYGDGTNVGRIGLYDNTNSEWIMPLRPTGFSIAAWRGGTIYDVFIPKDCSSVTMYLYGPPVNGGICWFDYIWLQEQEWSYSCTRNLDGTGANNWKAGDAVFNTGTTGDGWIDLYSDRGVYSGEGPTIVGNVRKSATYNDWNQFWAIGNLNAIYGYGSDTYGCAFGEYGVGNVITIDPTDGIRFLDSSDSTRAQLTGTTWTMGRVSVDNYIKLTPGNGIEFLDASDIVQAQLTGSTWTMGQVAASKGNVYITAGALSLRRNTTKLIELQTDGDLFIGTDTSDPTTTNLAIFTAGQTYNGQAVAAGDMIIGSNDSGKANIFWDQSVGRLNFRGGNSTQAYVDTDGSIMAGAGAVTINSTGLKIYHTGTTWLDRSCLRIECAGGLGKLRQKDSLLGFPLMELRLDADYGLGVQIVNNTTVSNGTAGVLLITSYNDTTAAKISILRGISGATDILLDADDIVIDGETWVSRSLVVGNTTTSIGDNSLCVVSKIFIGETANTKMTTGMTINQSTADNEIMAYKGSEVVHNFTAITEKDTYGCFTKITDVKGGLAIYGFMEAAATYDIGISLYGCVSGAPSTSKSTTGYGVVNLSANEDSSGYRTACIADANLVSISDHNNVRFIFDKEGEMHSDAIIGVGNDWDDWDDLALAADFSRLTTGKHGEMLKYNAQALEDAGLVTLSEDSEGKHAFIKHRAMLMFSMNVFRDVYHRMMAQDVRLARQEQALLRLGVDPQTI